MPGKMSETNFVGPQDIINKLYQFKVTLIKPVPVIAMCAGVQGFLVLVWATGSSPAQDAPAQRLNQRFLGILLDALRGNILFSGRPDWHDRHAGRPTRGSGATRPTPKFRPVSDYRHYRDY